jgi:5-methylcytosine-specific restriction endonuclease McrA
VIRVNRDAVKPPPSLATAGVEEEKKATQHYRKPANKETTFPFAAYKGDDVVAALNKLFHHKCAYCESSYKATSPADIEHFRPKGAIVIRGERGEKDKRDRPGYYWLAATWENLLASCPDCNRARTHPFKDPGDEEEMPGVRGKANKFPLIDEKRRVRTPPTQGEGTEAGQRLLIDPCRDRPEAHLEFLHDGLIWAKKTRSGYSRKGIESILAYGLTRKELKEARLAHLLLLAQKMRGTLFFIEGLEKKPGDPAFEQEFRILRDELRAQTAADQPYAGLTRQFVRAFELSIKERKARAFVTDLLERVTAKP